MKQTCQQAGTKKDENGLLGVQVNAFSFPTQPLRAGTGSELASLRKPKKRQPKLPYLGTIFR